MAPFLRKFMLTTHVTFSVGWFGAVAGFLALAIAGLTSKDPQLTRSAYIGMDLIAWFVIVPACLGALLSGVVQSLGSQWGLFKHYWVLVKFAITILATIVLFLHMQPIGYLADIASERALSYSELRGLRVRLIADAGAALLVLLIATVLSVYKPWGQIRVSLSARNAQESTTFPEKKSPWGLYVLFGLICSVVLLFITLHLTGVLGKHAH